MATFIKFEFDYVNAAAVVSISPPSGVSDYAVIHLADGTDRLTGGLAPSQERDGVLHDLLVALGESERDGTRIIGFIDGKVDVRTIN